MSRQNHIYFKDMEAVNLIAIRTLDSIKFGIFDGFPYYITNSCDLESHTYYNLLTTIQFKDYRACGKARLLWNR